MVVNIAQGARSKLFLKKQTDFDTQASGAFTRLRFNTQSLDDVKGSIESAELRGDRNIQDFRHGNRNAAGDISVELCWGDHWGLIESAMFGQFGTDSVVIGTAPQYYSIEDAQMDIGKYIMYQSMIVNQASFAIQPNDMVRATFSLVGKTGQAPQSTSAAGVVIEPSQNSPYDSFTGSIFLNAPETGTEIATITGLNFTINNGVNPAFALFNQTPQIMEYGAGRVTGTITAYYDDTNASTLIAAFLAETESTLVVNLQDPDNNPLEFRFPRIKYNGASKPVQNERSRTITLPFIALYDASVGVATAFKITKT